MKKKYWTTTMHFKLLKEIIILKLHINNRFYDIKFIKFIINVKFEIKDKYKIINTI